MHNLKILEEYFTGVSEISNKIDKKKILCLAEQIKLIKDKFGRIYNNSYLNEKRFDLEIFGKNKKDYLRMKKELNKLCL